MLNFEAWISKRFGADLNEENTELNVLENRLNQLLKDVDYNTNSFLILQFLKTLKYKPDQAALKNLSQDLNNIADALINTDVNITSAAEENIDKSQDEE